MQWLTEQFTYPFFTTIVPGKTKYMFISIKFYTCYFVLRIPHKTISLTYIYNVFGLPWSVCWRSCSRHNHVLRSTRHGYARCTCAWNLIFGDLMCCRCFQPFHLSGKIWQLCGGNRVCKEGEFSTNKQIYWHNIRWPMWTCNYSCDLSSHIPIFLRISYMCQTNLKWEF